MDATSSRGGVDLVVTSEVAGIVVRDLSSTGLTGVSFFVTQELREEVAWWTTRSGHRAADIRVQLC